MKRLTIDKRELRRGSAVDKTKTSSLCCKWSQFCTHKTHTRVLAIFLQDSQQNPLPPSATFISRGIQFPFLSPFPLLFVSRESASVMEPLTIPDTTLKGCRFITHLAEVARFIPHDTIYDLSPICNDMNRLS
jgi:hypothetical protein